MSDWENQRGDSRKTYMLTYDAYRNISSSWPKTPWILALYSILVLLLQY